MNEPFLLNGDTKETEPSFKVLICWLNKNFMKDGFMKLMNLTRGSTRNSTPVLKPSTQSDSVGELGERKEPRRNPRRLLVPRVTMGETSPVEGYS